MAAKHALTLTFSRITVRLSGAHSLPPALPAPLVPQALRSDRLFVDLLLSKGGGGPAAGPSTAGGGDDLIRSASGGMGRLNSATTAGMKQIDEMAVGVGSRRERGVHMSVVKQVWWLE